MENNFKILARVLSMQVFSYSIRNTSNNFVFTLQPNSIVQLGVDSINQLLENFLGINDDELGINYNFMDLSFQLSNLSSISNMEFSLQLHKFGKQLMVSWIVWNSLMPLTIQIWKSLVSLTTSSSNCGVSSLMLERVD